MAMNCIASLVLSDDVVAKLKGTDSIDRLTKTTQALFEGTKSTSGKPVNVEEWHKRREETCSWTACWAHFMNRGRDEGWPLHPMQYAALLVQIRTAGQFGVVHTDESRLRISNEIKKVGNSCYTSAKYSLAVQSYSIALEVLPASAAADERVTLLSNRAQALLQMSNGYWALRDLDHALTFDKKHQKSLARRKNACNMILLQGLQSRQDPPTNRYHLIHFQTMWALLSNRKRSRPSTAIMDNHPLVTNDELLSLCAVCFQRPLAVALVPCGHMICKKCAKVFGAKTTENHQNQQPKSATASQLSPDCENDCHLCEAKVLSRVSLDFV